MKSVLAAVLLCASFAAHASDPVAPESAGKEKKLCRTEEVTGSMFGKRVCHTKAEWAALEVERQRSAEQLHERSRGNGVDTPH